MLPMNTDGDWIQNPVIARLSCVNLPWNDPAFSGRAKESSLPLTWTDAE